MKGFYRLYFVALDYSSVGLDSVAEISVFEGILMEAGIMQVVVVYAVEGYTQFAPSPSPS